MASSRAALTEVLTPEAYGRFDELNAVFEKGCMRVFEDYRLPATLVTLGAKGSISYSATPVGEYRDGLAIDERPSYLAWVWQLSRGVFKSPWSKWESWTTSVVHSDEDAQRYVDNFEELAAAIRA